MGGNNLKLKTERRHGIISDTSGSVLIVIGTCLLFFALIQANRPHDDAMGPLVGGAICFGLGVGKIINARRLPKVPIMRLAESRDGLLTVSEITTALDIDPDIAIRTLKALAKSGIAQQRWEEVRKNLWEFPDYTKHPAPDPLARTSTLEPLDRQLATSLSQPTPPDATPAPATRAPVLQTQ